MVTCEIKLFQRVTSHAEGGYTGNKTVKLLIKLTSKFIKKIGLQVRPLFKAALKCCGYMETTRF